MIIKRALLILAGLVAVLVVIVLVNTRSFRAEAEAEASSLFEKGAKADTARITEEDLQRLPGPIQKYLRYAQVIGKPRTRFVRLRQWGKMRPDPNGSWIPVDAEQYYTVDPPGFVWFAHLRFFPLLTLTGRDRFADGQGNMHAKFLSTISVVNALGPEMDQGSATRFLNEIMWFPTAYLSKYLRWEPIDSTSAKITMAYGKSSVSAVLSIDAEGKLKDFTCARYRWTDEGSSLDTWSTPIAQHGEMGGFRIPVGGGTGAVWHLPSGDYNYFQIDSLAVEYDNPSIF